MGRAEHILSGTADSATHAAGPRANTDKTGNAGQTSCGTSSLLQGHPLAGQIAAPSFVFAGTVAENARFLAGQVDAMALCFFEAHACLAYTEDDLPPALADLALRTHIHLPTDLPWHQPLAYREHEDAALRRLAMESAALALAVTARAAYLRPQVAVLHPPQGSLRQKRVLLAVFAEQWQQHSRIPLLLENMDYCDIAQLDAAFLAEHGLGLCLDVGHLLSYNQETLLRSALPEQAGLVHWNAPGAAGTGDKHWPLTCLLPEQWPIAAQLMGRLPQGVCHVLEIFRWQGVLDSLPVLARLCTGHAGHTAHTG